jgi:hypothetical protein
MGQKIDFEILSNRQEILDTNRNFILYGKQKILGFPKQPAPCLVVILNIEYYQDPVNITLPEHQKGDYRDWGIYSPITYREVKD